MAADVKDARKPSRQEHGSETAVANRPLRATCRERVRVPFQECRKMEVKRKEPHQNFEQARVREHAHDEENREVSPHPAREPSNTPPFKMLD